MDIYTATEQAYKNGYEEGKKAAAEKILQDILTEYPILTIIGHCTFKYSTLKDSVKQCGVEIE